jgi:hypothetical protein
MLMGRLLLVVVLLTACGTVVPRAATVTPSPSPAATTRPSPTPSRSDFLAIVGGPKNSSVSLVASEGTVVATTTVDLPAFRMHAVMSWTSASRTRLYYLNGGSEVRFLAPDGTTGTATHIALGATEQAGFAVSPDDASIAVAIFSFTPLPEASYKGMRLYVEDLNGAGHHVDIFSSSTVAEFPVGWTSGRLIMAVSEPRCCPAAPGNPYDASSYHVVDPTTGTRLASLCSNSQGPEGPIEPVGAICYHAAQVPTYQRWDGSPFDAPAAVPNPTQFPNAVSPNGTRVAGGQAEGRIVVFGPSGYWDWLKQSGYVLGWLDNDRIVIQQIDKPALSVLELAGSGIGAAAEISPGGAYLGTFPASVQ